MNLHRQAAVNSSAHPRISAGARLAAPPIVHQVLRSPGRPLDSATRASLEQRFGHDFGKVRIHADERAAESARAVNAKAYAAGNDVVFNRGEYQPRSAAGLGLLAHELAHVVQQTAGRATAIPEPIALGAAGDAAEREAEQAGRGGWTRVMVSARDQPCLRRQPQQGDDKPEKEPKPVLPPVGDFKLDPKLGPLGPLGGASLEDINKALEKIRGLRQGASVGNVGCAPDWEMRDSGAAQGLCCPKFVTDPDRCCPPYRLTNLGRCCPTDQYADGVSCVKFPTPPIPSLPGTGPGGPPPERRRVPAPGRNVLGLPPLTVSLDIYFKLNRPSSVVSDGKALRDSLTVSGGLSLDSLVTWLKTGPQFSVQLTGKASIEGPTAHNRELGENRARSVAKALAQAGIFADRIADPPGLPTACPKLEDGIHNCGDSTASKQINERDRQVRATLFVPPGTPL
jgi:hypothetical protein